MASTQCNKHGGGMGVVIWVGQSAQPKQHWHMVRPGGGTGTQRKQDGAACDVSSVAHV
jgi:hypothetical protein